MLTKFIHEALALAMIGAWGCLGVGVLLWNWFLRWSFPRRSTRTGRGCDKTPRQY